MAIFQESTLRLIGTYRRRSTRSARSQRPVMVRSIRNRSTICGGSCAVRTEAVSVLFARDGVIAAYRLSMCRIDSTKEGRLAAQHLVTILDSLERQEYF